MMTGPFAVFKISICSAMIFMPSASITKGHFAVASSLVTSATEAADFPSPQPIKQAVERERKDSKLRSLSPESEPFGKWFRSV